ncbi:MAG: hypothetical protein RIQ56_506 [Candidatus Parcubacteria bacterium]|jgi:hypothetical protein
MSEFFGRPPQRRAQEGVAERPGGGRNRSAVKLGETGATLGQGYTAAEPVVVQRVEHVATGKEREFAVKRYLNEREAELSLSNYARSKDAGLPVVPTLRKLEGEPVLLISDLTEKGRKVVESSTNRPIADSAPVRLGSISNLSELYDSLKQVAHKAALAGIRVPADAYFFLFTSGDASPVECVLGDFDRTFEPEGQEIGRDLYRVNLEHISYALQLWLRYRNKNQTEQLDVEKIVEDFNPTLFSRFRQRLRIRPISQRVNDALRRLLRR